MDKEKLEQKQIWVYAVTIFLAGATGLLWSGAASLALLIEPVIAILLYSMFCQIPFLELKRVFQDRAFFKALLIGNFVFIPIIVWLLSIFLIHDPVINLGLLLVLLTPCID